MATKIGTLPHRIFSKRITTRISAPYRCRAENEGCGSWGPYILGVTWLDAEDHTISVTLGIENWSAALSFDLQQLGGK
jgi:hypothetical protein